MENAECYFCFVSFLEPSGYEDISRYPPPGRKYWSGGQSYEGRMVPDSRCYDRYAWDIPMCGHPAHVVCFNRANASAKDGAKDRCGYCREHYTIKFKIIFSAMPTMTANIMESVEVDSDTKSPPGKY
jgi:hypothetical protein